ncbi:protein FAM240C [Equus asinus]|uniref:protein FAM240C n=1 Tax=Equus asinus TaxID=9793 RepID=UPI0038F68415
MSPARIRVSSGRNGGEAPGDDIRGRPPRTSPLWLRNDLKKMSKNYTWKYPRRVGYDAGVLKTFWEKRIELHTKQQQSEDMRIRRSALDRLRSEWAQKLEKRNEMLQSSREAPQPSSLLGVQPVRAPDKTAA